MAECFIIPWICFIWRWACTENSSAIFIPPLLRTRSCLHTSACWYCSFLCRILQCESRWREVARWLEFENGFEWICFSFVLFWYYYWIKKKRWGENNRSLLRDCFNKAYKRSHTVGSIMLIKNSICIEESDCCVKGNWLSAFSSV